MRPSQRRTSQTEVKMADTQREKRRGAQRLQCHKRTSDSLSTSDNSNKPQCTMYFEKSLEQREKIRWWKKNSMEHLETTNRASHLPAPAPLREVNRNRTERYSMLQDHARTQTPTTRSPSLNCITMATGCWDFKLAESEWGQRPDAWHSSPVWENKLCKRHNES